MEWRQNTRAEEDGDGQRQQLLPGVGNGPGGGDCTVLYCILHCAVLYPRLYCTVLYCRWRRPGSRTPPMTTSTAASSGCAARTGQSPPARRRASRRCKIFVSRDNQLEKLETAKAA